VVGPDHFDKLLAFFVTAETLESRAFFRRDDVNQIFVDDVLEALTELIFGFFDLFLVLFFELRLLRRAGGGKALRRGGKAAGKNCGERESQKPLNGMANGTPQELKMGQESRREVVIDAARTAR
jgi:hypothetical protein